DAAKGAAIETRVVGGTWRRLLARRWPDLVLVLLALDVFVWFRHRMPIGFSDGGLQTMFYNPTYLLHEHLYAWSQSALGGVPTYSNISLVPLEIFAAAVRDVGSPVWLVQAVCWFILQLAGLLWTRAWLRRLFHDSPHRELTAFF